jgi:hypothetical protein
MKKLVVVRRLKGNSSVRLNESESLRAERVRSYIEKTHERFVRSLSLDHSAVTASGCGVLAGPIRKKRAA